MSSKYNSDETIEFKDDITFEEFVASLPKPELYPHITYKEVYTCNYD